MGKKHGPGFDAIMEIKEFEAEHSEWMEQNGVKLVPDFSDAYRVLRGLKKFDGGCPCYLDHPKCPCEKSLTLIEEQGRCHCGMFVRRI